VTGSIFRLGVERIRQPAHQGQLHDATLRLQQFYAAQHSPELILPATASGQHLLEDERTIAYLVFIPT
jgi:hypothetical protein